MDVKIHATGSDGNCVSVSNGEVTILVDLGLPKTKTEKILLAANVDPTHIDAVFVTHGHQDHARGLAFADKYKIPVYASEGTLKELGRLDSGIVLKPGNMKGFDAFRDSYLLVSSFSVSHDAMEPTGFTIRGKDSKISVMMDTGKVTGEMIEAMADSDIYVFECNHDEDMLVNGEYPDVTKSRILSETGHLSNEAAAAALARLIRGQGERIYLTHMSSNNNMPAIAEGTVKRALRARGLQAGKHYYLEVM